MYHTNQGASLRACNGKPRHQQIESPQTRTMPLDPSNKGMATLTRRGPLGSTTHGHNSECAHGGDPSRLRLMDFMIMEKGRHCPISRLVDTGMQLASHWALSGRCTPRAATCSKGRAGADTDCQQARPRRSPVTLSGLLTRCRGSACFDALRHSLHVSAAHLGGGCGCHGGHGRRHHAHRPVDPPSRLPARPAAS